MYIGNLKEYYNHIGRNGNPAYLIKHLCLQSYFKNLVLDEKSLSYTKTKDDILYF